MKLLFFDNNVGDQITRSFDLGGVDSAGIDLNLGGFYGVPNNSDIWRVSISSNGGTSFTTLEDLDKNSFVGVHSYPITTFTSTMVLKIELISNAGSTGTGIAIEDVSIGYRLPATGPQVFTMSTPFCSPFTVVSGQNITISTYANITYGTVPATPDVDAKLEFGAGPTTLIDFSSIAPTWVGGVFTWTGTIPSDVTISAGEAISLIITSNEDSFIFAIDYDSNTFPSFISLPTSTYINVDALEVYDAPYSGGSVITEEIIESTVYIRTTVSDPFGFDDITGLSFQITDPNTGVTNVSAAEVATAGCTKTYEYTWTMPAIGGDYEIVATADEGDGRNKQIPIPFPFWVLFR